MTLHPEKMSLMLKYSSELPFNQFLVWTMMGGSSVNIVGSSLDRSGGSQNKNEIKTEAGGVFIWGHQTIGKIFPIFLCGCVI